MSELIAILEDFMKMEASLFLVGAFSTGYSYRIVRGLKLSAVGRCRFLYLKYDTLACLFTDFKRDESLV